jgi:hypothetical protein
MHSTTLHKILHIHTYSTMTCTKTWQFNRGNMWIRFSIALFYWVDQHVVFIVGKFLVGALHPLAPPWLVAWIKPNISYNHTSRCDVIRSRFPVIFLHQRWSGDNKLQKVLYSWKLHMCIHIHTYTHVHTCTFILWTYIPKIHVLVLHICSLMKCLVCAGLWQMGIGHYLPMNRPHHILLTYLPYYPLLYKNE